MKLKTNKTSIKWLRRKNQNQNNMDWIPTTKRDKL